MENKRRPARHFGISFKLTFLILFLFCALALAGSIVALPELGFDSQVLAIQREPEQSAGTLQGQAAAPLSSGGAAQPGQLSAPPARPETRVQTVEKLPVYSSYDFLSGYLNNLNYPMIVDVQPWDNGSTNIIMMNQPGGGTTYWDYWPDQEPWNSTNHGWRDDAGNWHNYTTEVVQDATGKNATAYILVDRPGPGVMDKLWFTHDAVPAVFGLIPIGEPPELVEWGNLAFLGDLRIEVDDRKVFDGPIHDWFSGEAQHLTPDLAKMLVWHYRQFGSDGNIVPVPYQKHLKVSVYGGKSKPKWFMATGVTLPAGTRVKPYAGDVPVDQMKQFEPNLENPEKYIGYLGNPQHYQWQIGPDAPGQIELPGSGTVGALQIRIGKHNDTRTLRLQVRYGGETGIDVPLLGFFGQPDQVTLHHSTPVGIVDAGDAFLFYSNLPLPFQNGMTIVVSTAGKAVIPVDAQIATLQIKYNTQLRVSYGNAEKLNVFGPDYRIHIDGNGKLVGLVLVTGDQQYANAPRMRSNGKDEDPDKRVWPMGYLEGNLTITDNSGDVRIYSGQEDWAEGGFYFNLGFSTQVGGANRPFGGILRYRQAEDGYATLFRYFNDLSAFRFKDGLNLAFGHGTWDNNFPVTYQAIVFYYLEIPGVPSVQLPASDYTTLTSRDEQIK